jgi:GDPmannose 4,6-dehydratase
LEIVKKSLKHIKILRVHYEEGTNNRKEYIMKKALITGINGMDGSHLADFLLEKGYIVYGMERRSSSKQRENSAHLEGKITFINGDLTDQNSLLRCLKESDPDEVYNLAAMSFVGESWNTPEHTSEVTALGALRILEAVREYNPNIKFYQASSSEMFGRMVENPANENTPFYPRSPYGVAKLYGHWITKNYRESYGMFACSGILFNHESERRGLEFVTRKITDGIARIKLGLADYITLGNLETRRDWGYAPDYVKAMWLMLQQDVPDDYVIATGEDHSIREFLDIAFNHIGISDWSPYVKQDPRFIRPAEVDILRGNYKKAKEELGWIPETKFYNLVVKMIDNDLKLLRDK